MRHFPYRLGLTALSLCFWGAWGLAQVDDLHQTWDGSRTAPVHRIPLKDEFNQTIIPTESYAMPFSTRTTCAPCHDYAAIRGGLHFESVPGDWRRRPGEPWIWVDPATGTVLPLSTHGEPGTWKPSDLGLSPWDFTLLFGRHMTGGGLGDIEIEERTPASRWEVSGSLEINCMGCHNASRDQSHSEWAKQVMRQNFRWAAAAASALGEVDGMASRLPPTWDIYDGPNPDDTEWAVVPRVKYRREVFDSKHRVFFDIADQVEDRRCLTCHSVTPQGSRRFQVANDVHGAAGLGCVDCHRHDVSHRMIRGYEEEAEESHNPAAEAFACRGCHLGDRGTHVHSTPAGRLGAPRPRHAGIPAVHFERLACTTCHSGPEPGRDFTRVRTSRANRLGIYGIADWSLDFPDIREPVFVRDGYGRIAPHRILWPSFWIRLDDDFSRPLLPMEVEELGAGILDAEPKIAQILALLSLNPDLGGTPVLAVSGKAFAANLDGGLDVFPWPEGEEESEALWALRSEAGVVPLIPDFDPASEVPDTEVEMHIQLILESLAALNPEEGIAAVIHQGFAYRMREGFLDIAEYPGETGERPGLFRLREDSAEPLVSEFQLRIILALGGREETLTEEQVRSLLEALTQEGGRFAYVSGGRLFRLDDAGVLKSYRDRAAEPVLWPLAHPVRPAQQSLGVKGCTQCHTENSPFFFARISASGPLLTDQFDTRNRLSFMGLDQPYQRLFGLTFRVRPLLKILLAAAAVLLGSLVLLAWGMWLGRVTGLIDRRK
jgi:hypothetical protein